MFGLLKKKPAVVVATLNARLRPLDRADIQDAFDAAMERRGHGIRAVEAQHGLYVVPVEWRHSNGA